MSLGLGISFLNHIFILLEIKIVLGFKSRIASDAGIFEAESCLNTTLIQLNNIQWVY